jgi:hypothetical protein
MIDSTPRNEGYMAKRLKIKFRLEPVMSISRRAFREKKHVYLARANKRHKYKWGKSRIVYIGSTKVGAARIASSAVWKGADLLFDHGVKLLELHVVSCGKIQNLETWKKLETALLIKFREAFGEVPRANDKGKLMHWKDEKKYFADRRLQAVIEAFS